MDIANTFQLLYTKLILEHPPKPSQLLDCFINLSHTHKPLLEVEGETPMRPQFQVREVPSKTKPKKDEEERDWLREKPEERADQKLKKEVWERFNRNYDDRSERASTKSVPKADNHDNLSKCMKWSFDDNHK